MDEDAKDLPLGLMMQLGMDQEAMNAFAALPDLQKEKIVNYIKAGYTGDEVKNRIAEVMNSLDHHHLFL